MAYQIKCARVVCRSRRGLIQTAIHLHLYPRRKNRDGESAWPLPNPMLPLRGIQKRNQDCLSKDQNPHMSVPHTAVAANQEWGGASTNCYSKVGTICAEETHYPWGRDSPLSVSALVSSVPEIAHWRYCHSFPRGQGLANIPGQHEI